MISDCTRSISHETTHLKRSLSEVTLDELVHDGFAHGFERGFDSGFGKGYKVAVTSIRRKIDQKNESDDLDKKDVCVHVFRVEEADEDDVLDYRNVMMAIVNAEINKALDGKVELNRCIIVRAGEEMITRSYGFLHALHERVESFHKYRDMSNCSTSNDRELLEVALYSDVDISEDDVNVTADYAMAAIQMGPQDHIQSKVMTDTYLLPPLLDSISERIVFILHTLDMVDAAKDSTSLCIRYAIPRKPKGVRYCASNGTEWQFGVLKREGDMWINYHSDIYIVRQDMGVFDISIAAEVFQIILSWIGPENISSFANLSRY